MRSRDVIEFLGIWELLHNPDFNRVNFEAVKNEAGYNRFVIKANAHGQYNTLNISDLGRGIAQQIIHLFYLFKTSSDASAKCLNVLLNLPKACVHARTHGKWSVQPINYVVCTEVRTFAEKIKNIIN